MSYREHEKLMHQIEILNKKIEKMKEAVCCIYQRVEIHHHYYDDTSSETSYF